MCVREEQRPGSSAVKGGSARDWTEDEDGVAEGINHGEGPRVPFFVLRRALYATPRPVASSGSGDTTTHELTEPEHVRVGKGVVDEQAVLSPPYHPRRRQHLEVPREVGLVESRVGLELADASLAVPERLQDAEPRRFSQRPEAFGHEVHCR